MREVRLELCLSRSRGGNSHSLEALEQSDADSPSVTPTVSPLLSTAERCRTTSKCSIHLYHLFTKQQQSRRCRKQTYGYQEGKGGGINWEIEIDIYTLLYIKYIINKDLLYSTGKSFQYCVMTYMEKEFKKEWIYVYV